MAGPLTLDASVFLNAFNPAEPHHAESSRLMGRIRAEGIPLVAPTLLLPEVAATISRTTRRAETARSFADQLRILPGLILVSLDEALAMQAAQIAAEHRLRGSDAIYGAVSLRFGSPLVTLDREQYERLKPLVRSRTPKEVLLDLGEEP
jgi:predicted nucleic acid-binding protein